MKDFRHRLAVVTGGGTGMGRELALQLATAGAHVAICDVIAENMAETAEACRAAAPDGVRISTHECDVSDEAQVKAFRDGVLAQHATDHIHLLFNNAGIAGGGGFIAGDRAEWERTFGVCWSGVYYCARAFLPLLVKADEGAIVNTSSVNGFWATLGGAQPHTAYSAAKFAVKGFTEALRIDCRINAPHVKVSLVMPGHIGTSITHNSREILGKPPVEDMAADDLAVVRSQMKRMGLPTEGVTDDQIKAMIQQRMEHFRDDAPMTAAQAATVILDGVRDERWRILVGKDAEQLDEMVRDDPEGAYEPEFMQKLLAAGVFNF